MLSGILPDKGPDSLTGFGLIYILAAIQRSGSPTAPHQGYFVPAGWELFMSPLRLRFVLLQRHLENRSKDTHPHSLTHSHSISPIMKLIICHIGRRLCQIQALFNSQIQPCLQMCACLPVFIDSNWPLRGRKPQCCCLQLCSAPSPDQFLNQCNEEAIFMSTFSSGWRSRSSHPG